MYEYENSVTLVPESNLRKERILNIRILKNKAFLRLFLHTASVPLEPLFHRGNVPAFAMDQGIEATGAAWLLTIVNFSDLLDRFFVGYISDKKLIKRIYLIAISMATSGTIQCLYPFYKTYEITVLFTFLMDFFRISYQLFILQCC